jgi:hypothetical protein
MACGGILVIRSRRQQAIAIAGSKMGTRGVSPWYAREGAMAYKFYDVMTDDVAALRARAERYRRLARDLFDPRTSHEAAIIAGELEAEIARREVRPEMHPADSDAGATAQENCA